MLFVFILCAAPVLALSSSGLVVPGSGRVQKQLKCADFTVQSIVSGKLNLGDFDKIMSQIESEFPEVYFEEKTVEEVSNPPKVLPGLRAFCGGQQYDFRYVLNEAWIRRWIIDSRRGYRDVVRRISAADEFHPDFKASIHVMSRIRPAIMDTLMQMPSVGMGWSRTDSKKFRNTVITSDIFGRIRMFHNRSLHNLLHVLLPPIIPYDMAVDSVGNEIMSALSDREVHIVSDRPLPDFWNGLVAEYPLTAFIQMDPYDTDLPNGTIWYFRRSLEFMYPSLDTGARVWLNSVANNMAEPLKRRSLAPSIPSDTHFDATGQNLMEWINDHEIVFLSLYDDTMRPCDMANVQHRGRMHIGVNDHEILPEDAIPGMVLHILGYGEHVIIKNCAQVEAGKSLREIRKQNREKRAREDNSPEKQEL